MKGNNRQRDETNQYISAAIFENESMVVSVKSKVSIGENQ